MLCSRALLEPGDIIRICSVFELYTDHDNVVWHTRSDQPATLKAHVRQRVARQIEVISAMNPRVHHLPGHLNSLADMVSRWACPDKPEPIDTEELPQDEPTQDSAEASATATVASRRMVGVVTRQATRVTAGAPAVETERAEDRSQRVKPRGTEPEQPAREARAPAAGSSPETEEGWGSTLPDRTAITDAQRRDLPHPSTDAERRTYKGKNIVARDGLWYLDIEDRNVILVTPHYNLPARIIAACHCGDAGHVGSETTERRVRQRFWWPSLTDDVRNFCRACLPCLTVGPGRTVPRSGGHLPHAKNRFAILHYDVLTVAGAKVHVITDDFTGFMHAGVADKDDASTAMATLKTWCAFFGKPRIIITDSGTPLATARKYQDILRSGSIVHHTSAPYHPQGNGTAERKNKAIVETLAKLAAEYKIDGVVQARALLPLALQAVNDVESRRLGKRPGGGYYTPRQAALGTDGAIDIDFLTGSAPDGIADSDIDPKQRMAAARRLRQHLDKLHQGVQVERKDRKSKTKTVPVEFKVGSLVMATRQHKKDMVRAKYNGSWAGPYMVVGFTNPYVAKLRPVARGQEDDIITRHISNIAKYKDGEVTDEDKEFSAWSLGGWVVEEVDGHMVASDGELRLRVRYAGSDKPVYEPLWTLRNASKLVRKYIRKMPASIRANWTQAYKSACAMGATSQFTGVDDADLVDDIKSMFME